ncbi:MAG: threonine aldolase, partial [Firmicutes bacterium]|nr:threonine aldolase [Bacillota bacterium]
DAFYIGGTKNAFLFGEAIVIVNPALREDFRFIIKQRGGMFAKGRLIGIQFEEMFKDNLYFEIGRGSNEKAKRLREGIKAAGYEFMVDSPTNQIFPIFPEEMVQRLEKDFFFYRWAAPKDGKTPIRLVTSWVTTDEDIDAFLNAIK